MSDRVQQAREAVRLEWERMHGESMDEHAPWEVVARQFPWVEQFALHLIAVRAERVEVTEATVADAYNATIAGRNEYPEWGVIANEDKPFVLAFAARLLTKALEAQ